MFHVHSSCICCEKHLRQYLTKASVNSKYRVDLESVKSNDNCILS